jgi:hypothetical protein
MKILYKPFAIIAGIIASRLGKGAFRALWSKIDEEDPPSKTMADEPWPKVLGAAVLEAGIMAGVAAVVERSTAKGFHHLTGIWPGDKPEDKDDEG